MYDYGYNYDYGYTAESIADATMASAGLLGLSMGIMIFSLILSLISIISYAKIFKKAGKPWWASIVPIYNIIVMIEIAKLPMWYIALFFVPIANVYALFKINIEMAKKFGKDTGYGVGMTLLSIIFIPLLAFSDNKYESEEKVTENTNNEFDVNQVINSGIENNVQNNNVNVMTENSVSTIENVQLEPVNMMNVNAEPVVEPQVTEIQETTDNNINSIPVEESIPTMESVQLEPVNMMDVNVEPVVEPQVTEIQGTTDNNINSIPVEESIPTMESVQVEPVNMADVNVEPVVEPQVNAFNIPPVTELPEVKETSITEQEINTELEDKKVCKNCGNELPEIVSICPTCGTDNE